MIIVMFVYIYVQGNKTFNFQQDAEMDLMSTYLRIKKSYLSYKHRSKFPYQLIRGNPVQICWHLPKPEPKNLEPGPLHVPEAGPVACWNCCQRPGPLCRC